MDDPYKSIKLTKFTQVVQAISGLSVIIGVIFTAIQIVDVFNKIDSAAASTKLTALTAMNQFIEDDSKVRKQMEQFLSSKWLFPVGNCRERCPTERLPPLLWMGRRH
jgi:hypothetical protein